MSDALEAAGAVATAGLAAGAIEAGAGGAIGPGTPGSPGTGVHGAASHGACLNCGAALHGAFCQACGQAAHVHRSLLHLIEELLHGLFHFDAKGWRTLPLLIGRPGVLTRRYIDGQRVRYVSPLALFLFTVFLMFFAASLGGSAPAGLAASGEAQAEAYVDLAKARTGVAEAESKLEEARRTGRDVDDRTEDLADAKQELAGAEMALHAIGAPVGGAAPGASGVSPTSPGSSASSASSAATAATPSPASPASIAIPGVHRIHKPRAAAGPDKGYSDIHWLDQAVKHAFANPELTLYKLKSSAYKYSFLLVPISLPFVWLLFLFRRGVTAYDHAIFVLYSLSFMSLLFVALVALDAVGLPGWAIGLMAMLVPPVHMGLQLRETYGLGLWSTLWRTAALLVVASIVFLLFVLIVGYMALA